MYGTNGHLGDREQSQQVLQDILARSATDKAFRTKLIADPRAAVAEFAGVGVDAIPQNFNVRFLENTADATLVLPDPVAASPELDEAQLETVSGGTGADVWVGVALAVTVIVDNVKEAYRMGQAAR